MRIYGVSGWKDTGKTTLMERLVANISGRGFSVSTIKHAHHDADVDHPGRDSHRHRQAGAAQVLLASPVRWALMTELKGAPEPLLPDLLGKLAPVDLVLIEGYKRSPHPKIETYRAGSGHRLLVHDTPSVRAVATDTPLDGLGVPQFGLDDIAAIAGFILREVGLPERPEE